MHDGGMYDKQNHPGLEIPIDRTQTVRDLIRDKTLVSLIFAVPLAEKYRLCRPRRSRDLPHSFYYLSFYLVFPYWVIVIKKILMRTFSLNSWAFECDLFLLNFTSPRHNTERKINFSIFSTFPWHSSRARRKENSFKFHETSVFTLLYTWLWRLSLSIAQFSNSQKVQMTIQMVSFSNNWFLSFYSQPLTRFYRRDSRFYVWNKWKPVYNWAGKLFTQFCAARKKER